jgi:hypothetical protein
MVGLMLQQAEQGFLASVKRKKVRASSGQDLPRFNTPSHTLIGNTLE